MLKNHIKIAWRSLKSNSLFSAVNILGLSLGLAITIVLYLFITQEQSFDTMYSNNKNIYRVLLHMDYEGQKGVWCNAPAALAPAMKNDIPEVKATARMLKHNFGDLAFIRTNNTNFTEKKLYWVDNAFFDIFNITFLTGQAKTALNRPNTAVLSQSAAKKYFGTVNPIGKTITVDNDDQLEITGIFKDFPNNSTLDCNIMASFKGSYFDKNPSWGNASFSTYCLLNNNASRTNVQAELQQTLNKNVPKEEQWFTFSLQPLKKIHLYSAAYDDPYNARIGDIKEIRNLGVLAILILMIACINYMNLITARSQKRSKDVAMNKTMGASAKNLLLRFYVETGVITFISLLIGIVLAFIVIPIFNAVTAQNLDISLVLNINFFIGLFMIWLVTTLISGSYPAIYLSSFSPIAILNPTYKRSNNNVIVRKGLVILQFTASVILIVAVLVIYNQLQFMQSKKLGYNPEGVIAISVGAVENKEHLEALLLEYKGMANVIEAGLAQGFPGINVSGRTLAKNENDKEGISIQTNRSDAAILDVLQLKLLAGKMPPPKIAGDTLVEVVLNKKAVDYLGYSPEEAIGKKVLMQLGNNASIVGVVDNFNFASLHQPIGAYAFHNGASEPKSYLLVRYRSESVTNVVNQFEGTFEKIIPNSAFEYTFIDKSIERLYAQEKRAVQVSMIFCGLAIFVASLGLFALAAFTTEQRTKEIGVRKVLGASPTSITKMLSLDFVNLILIALLIAFPISYWLMEGWLETFAYRIAITWTIFLIAGGLALAIALLTISFQSAKAAMTSPIKSLKTE